MSILSSRAVNSDQQAKHSGKIRPGIKVLTKAAQQNPTAVRLYDEGVFMQMKFSEIEKLIKDKTGLPNPMYPRNTPYFSVAASDFGMPEIARMIVERYGEVRDGDTRPHLYRFPVVFHSDDLNVVYPNQFKRHGGEPSYESHYGEDGVRYCRYLPELSEEQKAENRVRRIKKLPRREKVIRGRCDPGTCTEFQQGQCKFKGRLMFYIPGIPTTGLLAMETSSEYAAEGIWSDLQRIIDALGTIPRMNPNKPNAPVFYITKVLEQRTYFDETGKKQVGQQWVPKLQADIDVGQLLQTGRTVALPAPSTPVAWLASPKGMPDAQLLSMPQSASEQATTAGEKNEVTIDPADKLAQMVAELGLDEAMAMEYFDLKIADGWENNPDHVARAIEIMVSMSRIGGKCAALLMSVTLKVALLHIDLQSFNNYAFTRYGKGFTRKEDVLARIETEVDEWSKQPREQVIATMADALSPV
jgi:hypothetical protein